MATQHKVSRKSACRLWYSARLEPPRTGSTRLAHLYGMDTAAHRQLHARAASQPGLDLVVTLSQLAAQLGVSVQTLYDLRCQGRGPRGFRVGRELRFRISEIDSWLAQLEADDEARHPRETR